MVDHPVGTARLTVWADPDVGTGTFLFSLEAPAEDRLPGDCSVAVEVRPADGRRAAERHAGKPRRKRGEALAFEARVPFDEVGVWDVTVDVRGTGLAGTARTTVDVTPPGQGPVLDFVLYLFPFVAVAFLFVRAALGRREAARPAAGTSASPPREPR